MKLLQALLALFACAFLPLHAASLADLTWTTTDGRVTITDCKTSASGELVIPATIEGNPVTSIDNDAFDGCTSLTSITIPDSVTSIGWWAFFHCGNLTSITIGNGVTSIGGSAFNGCTSLTSITIPDGVTSIGDGAFRDCASLTSITIPDSVTGIGDRTFYNCTSLTSITIPDSVTSIGESAFNFCTSLTNITIPDGVTSIGNLAFDRCTSLTSITIGNGVTSIGNYAFYNCASLTAVTFMGAAPTVGPSTFTGVADGAIALVTVEALSSFGGFGDDWNGLTLRSTEAPPQSLEVQLAQMTAERDAAIAERDARPTQASFDAVKAERDDRPTLSEVKDARLGSVVLQSDGANDTVKICLSIEETDDFKTWTSNGEVNEIIVPLEAGKRFYRFALEDK